MEFSIKLHTIKLGWSIVYIVGSHVKISPKNISFVFQKVDFVLANSVDPDEMQRYAAFHLSQHCLPKKLALKGFPVHKGLTPSLQNQMFLKHKSVSCHIYLQASG